jgi:nickel-dependent lactate racemase
LQLRYGSRTVEFEAVEAEVLQPACPAALPASAVEDALQRPLGTPPLEELVRGAGTAVVLVSGKDRITRADLFMSPILQTLQHAGIPPRRTRIIVATGTHVPFEPSDIARIAGAQIHPEIEVVGHQCRGDLVSLGVSSRGSELKVNPLAFEADVKILTGRITHHYFAGFTGGRKSVLPGVSGFDTILRNHAMVLSHTGDRPVPPGTRNGNLDGNPVHEEMMEAARLFQPSFLVNTVLDLEHRLLGVFAGELDEAHRAGCLEVQRHFALPVKRQADLVLASCGGDPYDVSFMQAIKTLINCHEAVRDGGVMLLLAECPEGIREGFLQWTPYDSLPDLLQAVRANYHLTGHNTYLLREIQERIRVVLVSSCPGKDVAQMGFHPAGDESEGWRRAVDLLGDDAPGSTYAIPYGNITVIERRPE